MSELFGGETLKTTSPFKGIPFKSAGQFQRRFGGPLSAGTGFRIKPKFERRLGRATGPTADLIRGIQDIAPSIIPQAQTIGADIAARAPGQFNALRDQINSFLSALPNFQAAAGKGISSAEQLLSDVSAPGRSSALFQQLARDVLEPVQANAAARGLLGAGTAQAREQDVLQQLGLQFALAQPQIQAAAIQNLLGSLGAGTQLAGAGLPAAAAGLEALPQLQALASAQFGLPLSAASSLFNLISGTQQPLLSLLALTQPFSAVVQRPDVIGGIGKLLGGGGGLLSGAAAFSGRRS